MLLWSGSIARQTTVQEGIVSPAYYAFDIDHTVDKDYFEFVARSPNIIRDYKAISLGTNVRRKKARFEDFLTIEKIFPPLPEQKKIAAILSSVDEAIEATEAVIEQTRTVKKGLLQELLTRGIGHTEFKKTAIGEMPKGWVVVKLDNVATRGSGHTPSKSKPEYWDGDIKWVSLTDSSKLDRVYISDTNSTISPAGIENSSARLLPEGTVFVSRDAGVGKSAIMVSPMAVSQHFIAWTCGPRLDNIFLYYWLQSQKNYMETIATGSTIKTIGLSFFKKWKIALPGIEEQKKIATTLLTLDKSIWSSEQQVSQLNHLKHGLLQDLLTGKVRVNTLDLPALLNAEAPAEAQAE